MVVGGTVVEVVVVGVVVRCSRSPLGRWLPVASRPNRPWSAAAGSPALADMKVAAPATSAPTTAAVSAGSNGLRVRTAGEGTTKEPL